MTITLTPNNEATINRKLAEGDFTDADKGTKIRQMSGYE